MIGKCQRLPICPLLPFEGVHRIPDRTWLPQNTEIFLKLWKDIRDTSLSGKNLSTSGELVLHLGRIHPVETYMRFPPVLISQSFSITLQNFQGSGTEYSLLEIMKMSKNSSHTVHKAANRSYLLSNQCLLSYGSR